MDDVHYYVQPKDVYEVSAAKCWGFKIDSKCVESCKTRKWCKFYGPLL